MSMQDPIADMLTRIRNAGSAGLADLEMPGSKMKASIADVLKSEGYIKDYSVATEGVKSTLSITLKYYNGKPVIEGLKRVSKPSCRTYCGCREIPRVKGGLGIVVLSTPGGVISGKQAVRDRVGGEILCYVW